MSKKIRIVFLFGPLGGGGAERQFGWLIKGIDRSKFEPIVISIGYKEDVYKNRLKAFPNDNILHSEFKQEEFSKFMLYRKIKGECPIYFIERQSLLKTQRAIYKCIKREAPEILFFVSPIAAIYGGFPSFLYNKAKVIHGIRGNGILLNYKKSIANLYHWCSQIFINQFVGNSQALINNVHKSGFRKSKTRYIYNGVPEFYNNQVFNKNETLKIGYIARFESVKNHELFLNAISLLDEKKNFTVHLYGTGTLEKKLKKLVKTLGIETKVFFEGWATDVSEILKHLDIVCLTSNFEGFNNSISEAQMHGIPVVTTDCTGSSEIVVDNQTGFVVPRNDSREFTLKLEELISNTELRQKFSEEAFKRSRSSFTIKKMCQNYESLFIELTQQK